MSEEKLLDAILKNDRITKNLLENGMENIVKMQNLSLNDLEQIERMNNLSLNKLKKIVKTRHIKTNWNTSKEDFKGRFIDCSLIIKSKPYRTFKE